MIIHRKKRGFTVAELAIVMTLSVVVLEIIWTMFSVSNRIISDVTIKSDLQKEGQAIEEKLSDIGMQAIGIEPIVGDDGNETTGEIKNIIINSYDKDGNRKGIEVKNESGKIYIDGIPISNDLESIKIVNKEIIHEDKDDLADNTYIDLVITLSKMKTYKDELIVHSIKIRTVFRNKDTLGIKDI